VFPSPCGERVLLNRGSRIYKGKSDYLILFPSPCGERVLLNLSQVRQLCISALIHCVSVPLRGKGSVELNRCAVGCFIPDSMFPSPCGERVLLNSGCMIQYRKTNTNVSVPLRGKGSVEL